MKLFISFFCILLSISCGGNNTAFDKDYYERITEIKLPYKEVVQSYDNGEFLTCTELKFDKDVFIKFIENNKFLLAKNDLMFPNLMSKQHFTIDTLPTRGTPNIYYLGGGNGKNNWWYLADLNRNLLWVEIIYPDWSGN